MFSSLEQNFKSDNASSNDLKSSTWNRLFLKVKKWNTILYFDKSKYTSNKIYPTTLSTLTNLQFIISSTAFGNMKYDCCAVHEVNGTTNDFDNTPWCTTSGSCQDTSSQIPRTCCKDVTLNNYTSAPSNCHASVNRGTYKRVTAA